MKKRRESDIPDPELWEQVTRSVKPLPDRRAKTLAGTTHFPGPALPDRDVIPPQALHHRVGLAQRREPPPLTGLDRRTEQKMVRGKVEPEARIDLHGEGLAMARLKLQKFLSARQAAGDRLVLVITGKGSSPFSRHTLHGRDAFHAPEREGRIRKEAQTWLHEAEFRQLVAGFQPAHPRHGGGGAIYVRLRRLREH